MSIVRSSFHLLDRPESSRMAKVGSRPTGGPEPIGQRVRRLRTERNLSQDRVTLSANIDQSGFSKFERGVRSLGEDALRRVASVLGVEFELMVKDTDFSLQPANEARSPRQG